MIEELRKLVTRIPFVPFIITMSSGLRISVRSREHIIVGSKGLVVVEDDEGLFEILPLLHITSLQAREPAL
ncbi:MAG TPA: hypothetical protein VHW03_03185 [Chthoniobacterales bacterium]|jgi:hypothetical protein|nr:hypothetical protein [Chthoniobacterales bacterium]